MYNLKRARRYKKTTEDIVYTPKNIAELTLNLVKPYIKQTDKILEPCIYMMRCFLWYFKRRI